MSNIRPISKDLQQKAIEELNEDVSRIPQDIQAIKDWLHHQKHIKARTDDQTILSVLRGCKFSLERTKEKIESYYTMRTLLPEIFKNRDPFQPELQYLLKLGILVPILTQKDSTSPRLVLINYANYDPAIVNKANFIKILFIIWDILQLEDDQMNINGLNILCEFDGIQISQIIPPSLIFKCIKIVESQPTRIKGIHMLNMPSFMGSIYNFIKSVMSPNLRQRVQLHNKKNLEELYKSIPKEELPKEYGGDGPSLREIIDFWKKMVESYADWFNDEEQYRTNEKLRPGKPKTAQECFGVEGVDGSFRKLNID